jgi:hypothetical protein
LNCFGTAAERQPVELDAISTNAIQPAMPAWIRLMFDAFLTPKLLIENRPKNG